MISNLTSERIADLADDRLAPAVIARTHVLEASAGTGKTFSIQSLYLRLILVEGLTVQEILVVTFTKAATRELRERLQGILRDALDHIDELKVIEDPGDRTRLIVEAAAASSGEADVRCRLQMALLDFDNAAVYTIHGFCQRVLNRFAFETGQGFDVEPAGDRGDEIEELCRDWWRRNMYTMDPEVASLLCADQGFSIDRITRLARKIIAKPDAVLSGLQWDSDDIQVQIQHSILDLIAKAEGLDLDKVMPGAPAEIRDAVGELKQGVLNIRPLAEQGRWGRAVDSLMTLAEEGKKSFENPAYNKAAEVSAACSVFKDLISGAPVSRFTCDGDGNITHPGRPDLKAEHSAALRDAVESLRETVESCRPIEVRKMRAGAPLAAWGGIETLHKHFFPVAGESRPELSDVTKAIKDLAGGDAAVSGSMELKLKHVFPETDGFAKTIRLRTLICAARSVKSSYEEGRYSARTASFDDYLINLRNALKQDGTGLVAALRSEFKAALIDEFQDTDPVQWEIFDIVFSDSGMPCFLVGDPKQAIYRFRNGDIETYLSATEKLADSKFILNTNRRSETRLIDAVNQIFIDPGASRQVFGRGIDYSQPLSAAGRDEEKSLLIDGIRDERPFKVKLVKNYSGNLLPGKLSRSARVAYALTAAEISGILNDARLTIGGERVKCSDIAVLVNEHKQGEIIAGELKKLNIPSVRQGSGNVWKSDEGLAVLVVLEAVMSPGDLSCVRRALMTNWFGFTTADIAALNAGKRIDCTVDAERRSCGIEDWVRVFEDLRETWMKRGYPALFRKLAAVTDLKRRLLSMADREGQRRLVNIDHLSELIEKKIQQERKGPDGVLAWIRRQFDQSTADYSEDLELRLETDDNAVKIMTLFASKGLQFPIVFAPTLFMMAHRHKKGDPYEYHNEAGSLVVATDPEKFERDLEKEQADEELARQMYVALTRAVHRTVTVALNSGTAKPRSRLAGTGRFADVLDLPLKAFIKDAEGNVLEAAGKVPEGGSKEVFVDLAGVDAKFGARTEAACAIEVSVWDEASLPCRYEPGSVLTLTPPPCDKPKPDTSKGHGSFSSLAPHADVDRVSPAGFSVTDEEMKDRDSGAPDEVPAADPVVVPEGIFAFPGSARTGTCWHDILENISFRGYEKSIKETVAEQLRIHGFLKNAEQSGERIKLVEKMIGNVLSTDLPALREVKRFALNEIEDSDRKSEWEFNFASVSGKTTQAVRDILAAYPEYKDYLDALGDWNKPIPGGYLTGFVDLLFKKGRRYYVADWKSNRLKCNQKSFDLAGMRQEMSRHGYWLQYLFYSVAVHQYLSAVIKGYDYSKHFGGAYWIFMRGVNGEECEPGRPYGIYADCPPQKLIEELSVVLGAFE